MGQGARWRGLYALALWAITLLAAIGIGAAGLMKFAQSEHWRVLFAGWGYPPRFMLLVGLAEVTGALGLLAPRLASYASLLLSLVMLGAFATLLSHSGGALGWGATPLFYLVLLAIVAAARWRQRVRVGPT